MSTLLRTSSDVRVVKPLINSASFLFLPMVLPHGPAQESRSGFCGTRFITVTSGSPLAPFFSLRL